MPQYILTGTNKIQIDTDKILSIKYHKKLFNIFNKGDRYELIIKYDESEEYTFYMLVGAQFYPVDCTESHKYITCRYSTEQNLLNDINEIKKYNNINVIKTYF